MVLEINFQTTFDNTNKNLIFVNLQKKTTKMLDFGVERVVWILTYVKKVIVADRQNNTWFMVDWSSDIELLEGIYFNIQGFLDKRGVNPDELKK
jgi:hypothetical protein